MKDLFAWLSKKARGQQSSWHHQEKMGTLGFVLSPLPKATGPHMLPHCSRKEDRERTRAAEKPSPGMSASLSPGSPGCKTGSRLRIYGCVPGWINQNCSFARKEEGVSGYKVGVTV